MLKYLLILSLLLQVNVSYATSCRSSSVKHQFDVQQGYPHGRKGYVVDHVCALVQGGLDITSNMQYQTVADGKTKDRVENTAQGKLLYCNSTNSLPYRTVFNCK